MSQADLLQKLSDRQELTELVARQGLWLDERRADETLRVFTEDVVGHTPGGTVNGAEALAEVAMGNHREYGTTQHAASGVIIDLDGDEAVVRAVANVMFTLEDGKQVALVTSRYRFGARRTEAGWRLSSIEVTPTSRTAPLGQVL